MAALAGPGRRAALEHWRQQALEELARYISWDWGSAEFIAGRNDLLTTIEGAVIPSNPFTGSEFLINLSDVRLAGDIPSEDAVGPVKIFMQRDSGFPEFIRAARLE